MFIYFLVVNATNSGFVPTFPGVEEVVVQPRFHSLSGYRPWPIGGWLISSERIQRLETVNLRER